MLDRYLFIFEDGSLQTGNTIPQEILDAADDGLYDIIDMETRTQLVSGADNTWNKIESIS